MPAWPLFGCADLEHLVNGDFGFGRDLDRNRDSGLPGLQAGFDVDQRRFLHGRAAQEFAGVDKLNVRRHFPEGVQDAFFSAN